MFQGSSDEITRRDSGRDAAGAEGRGRGSELLRRVVEGAPAPDRVSDSTKAVTEAVAFNILDRAGPRLDWGELDAEGFNRAYEEQRRLIAAGAPTRDVFRATLKVLKSIGGRAGMPG